MYLHVLAAHSRWIYFQQKKVPEMEFSDKVDIKNAQEESQRTSVSRDQSQKNVTLKSCIGFFRDDIFSLKSLRRLQTTIM